MIGRPDPSFTMKDNIKTILHQTKGELTLDGIYLGEIVIDKIYMTESDFIIMEFNLNDISLKFLSDHSYNINFQSKWFSLKCDRVHGNSIRLRKGFVSIVMHKSISSGLVITINPEGE